MPAPPRPDPPRPDPPPARPAPPPLDPPMVPFALAGTAIWAVVGGVLLIADGPTEWQRVCLAGVLLGGLGVAVMIAHDRRRPR